MTGNEQKERKKKANSVFFTGANNMENKWQHFNTLLNYYHLATE
jgi:hypothetical protein